MEREQLKNSSFAKLEAEQISRNFQREQNMILKPKRHSLELLVLLVQAKSTRKNKGRMQYAPTKNNLGWELAVSYRKIQKPKREWVISYQKIQISKLKMVYIKK